MLKLSDEPVTSHNSYGVPCFLLLHLTLKIGRFASTVCLRIMVCKNICKLHPLLIASTDYWSATNDRRSCCQQM